MLWLLLVPLISVAFLYQAHRRKTLSRHGKPLKSAPDRLPVLGHAFKFLRPRNELFTWCVDCQQQHGLETLEISVPTLPPGVIISDPVNLEFVLKNEHLVSKGDFVKSRFRDLFGYGIINASGDLWKAQRKAGLKFFSGTNLELMVTEILPVAYSRLRTRLLKHTEDGTVVDMQSVFLDFTSLVVGNMAYDMDLDSTHPFSQAFDYASDQVGRRFQNPMYPITEFFFGSRLQDALLEVKRFGRKIVANARNERSKLAFESLITNEEPVFNSLIDSLLEAFRDQTVVADSALNFLSAGKDTTAQALTWTLYAILSNPSALDLIRKEAEPVGRGKAKTSQPMYFADLQPQNAPMTMAVFYEALRFYPPIPFEIQECQQDLMLPDGTILPKGAVVVWCIWAMNRAKEIHGSDADDFKPERWIDEDGKFVYPSSHDFPVFNGGPRSCLGRKMAETIAIFVLRLLLQEFHFSIPEHDVSKQRRAQNSLTLPMEGGLALNVISL